MENEVILVDENDNSIGSMEKLKAHQKGVLHRAFSVFIYNSIGEVLLQKRASGKYHSGGLWSNTCCSHPRPGETTKAAANRRLDEEMGLSANLLHTFSFTYKSELDKGLTEHELDHVFIGFSDSAPSLNPIEAEDFCYIKPNLLEIELKNQPEKYSAWLKICFEELQQYTKNNKHQNKVGQ